MPDDEKKKKLEDALSNLKNMADRLEKKVEAQKAQGAGDPKKMSGDVRAALDFFNRHAAPAAERHEYAEAIQIGNDVLKEIKGTIYEGTISRTIEVWKNKQKLKEDVVDRLVSKHKLDEVGIEDFEKRLEAALKSTERPEALEGDEYEAARARLKDKTDRKDAQKMLVGLSSKFKGERDVFKAVFTKADEIQKIVNEANKLADEAKEKFDQSKLERAIARLRQAEEICLENPDEFRDQLREVQPLIERYEYDYQKVFGLFGITEEGRASPFALNKINYQKDDVEVKRDDFDALAMRMRDYSVYPEDPSKKAELDKLRGTLSKRYEKDPGAKRIFDRLQDFDGLERLFKEYGGDAWGYENVRTLVDRWKNKYSDKPTKEIITNLERALNSRDPDAIAAALKTARSNALRPLVEDATAESERSRRYGQMMGTYHDDRHLIKAKEVRDRYRGRPLSGHKNWGEGGWGASDAAEWIGFSRNPIETLGNLVATIITVYLVVYKIVGPVLDMFSFYIPFMGILKFPIFLIIIIILHPMLKGILEPIKKDLHFIAKDPYWYEEGTNVDKLREGAYSVGGRVGKGAKYANEGLEKAPGAAFAVGAAAGGAAVKFGEDMKDKAEEIKERAKKRLDELKVSKSQKKIARDNDVDVIN